MSLTQADVDAAVAKALASQGVGQPPPSVVREQDTSPVSPVVTQSGDTVTIKFKLDPKKGKISKSGGSILRAMTNGMPITQAGVVYKLNVLCYEKI